MPWTVVDDENAQLNVRAVIDVRTEQNDLRDLIVALEKRLQMSRTKEKTDD